jgi:glyoxylase-like metal-dependent hydrolase (beta-lactamase superfamily II)
MSTTPISEHVTLIDAPFHGAKGVLGTYIVRGERSIIVDPGPTVSIPYVEQALKDTGINELTHIVPTHIHLDHSGGTWKLMETHPSTTLIVHPRGAQHMIDPSRLEAGATALFGDHVQSYGSIRGTPPERTIESTDNQEIDLGGATIKIIWTPGHAAHHQCVYIPEDHVLIAGDAAGYYSQKTDIIMPTTPPPFNPLMALDSLNRLIDLSPETICYGHFGYTGDAVEKLLAHREQIKTWLEVIKQNWEPGKSLPDIYEAIRKSDPYAMKAGGFTPESGERSPPINLQGFIQYIEWEKTRQ